MDTKEMLDWYYSSSRPPTIAFMTDEEIKKLDLTPLPSDYPTTIGDAVGMYRRTVIIRKGQNDKPK